MNMNLDCRVCEIIPKLFGKKILMPLLGHRYKILLLNEVKKYVKNLDVKIVGGLIKRGWTMHDIDIRGNKKDIAVLAHRLKENNIPNPVHYCGEIDSHSHIECVYYGIKMALTGRGY